MRAMVQIGSSDLDVPPLVLGGNVFGWTTDAAGSEAVLDRWLDAGGGMVDSADAYSAWVEGNSGGESETILGAWMVRRGVRDRVTVATKVGMAPARSGLSPDNVRAACDDSLTRLGVDVIDLYWAHQDDESVPQEDYVEAFDALVRDGKVRALGASNFTAERLSGALALQREGGLAEFVALQPPYNLVARRRYEQDLAPTVVREGVAGLPYSGLASGFLSGKYRPGTTVESVRSGSAAKYLERGGESVLQALDDVAGAHGVPVAAVALAWLRARPGVAAPLASARTPEQLEDLLPVLGLELTPEEVERLTAASDAMTSGPRSSS